MYKNHKVICCTAAGRRRYMQYLFPYIVSEELVDRYDIWVNTTDNCDIEFFRMMAAKYPKVNLVWQPDNIVNGIASINKFYTLCQDEDAIYIKIDDDVVWMEPDIFKKVLAFRVDNPDALLVSPMVVNNAICSYLWQVTGKMGFGKYMNALSNHRILWKRGEFSLALHQWFLDKLNNDYDSCRKLHIGRRPIACNRFSINFILWFGRDFATFKGEVLDDDEEFLSVIKPTQMGRINLFDGDSLISHFAFRSQREILDDANILEQYGDFLAIEFAKDPAKAGIFSYVKTCLDDIERHKTEITALPCPYPILPQKKGNIAKTLFKKYQKRIRRFVERNTVYTINDYTNGSITK